MPGQYNSVAEQALELIERLKALRLKVYLVSCGAGTSAIKWLFHHHGASKLMLEAVVPYSRAAVKRFLNTQDWDDSYVSTETAVLLAEEAYNRGTRLLPETDDDLLSVACTAAIETLPARRGANRAHVACYNGQIGHSISVEFTDKSQTRYEQETIASALILNALAEMLKVDGTIQIDLKIGTRISRASF